MHNPGLQPGTEQVQSVSNLVNLAKAQFVDCYCVTAEASKWIRGLRPFSNRTRSHLFQLTAPTLLFIWHTDARHDSLGRVTICDCIYIRCPSSESRGIHLQPGKLIVEKKANLVG